MIAAWNLVTWNLDVCVINMEKGNACFPRISNYTSGKTVSNSKNPGIYSGWESISSLSHFTIPPSPQSSAGTWTANAATAMLIYTCRKFWTINLITLNFHETSHKPTAKKIQGCKELLYDTWVLTFGGPLWNFFSKFCVQNKHEGKDLNDHGWWLMRKTGAYQ